jgi:hypothetical protein
MSKLRIAAVTATLLAGVAVSTGASAACWWNGSGWACGRAPAYGYGPSSQFNNPATYGYMPRGLPHANGPQPGGGGCYMGQAKSGCGDE